MTTEEPEPEDPEDSEGSAEEEEEEESLSEDVVRRRVLARTW